MSHSVFTVPNLISFIRILLAPVLLTAALWLNETLFLTCFAGSLLSDFLDGFAARLLNQQSKLGSQLDTMGDVLTGVTVIIGGVLLWPGVLLMERFWFVAIVGMLTCAGIVTISVYHHLPSYHTWTAKMSTAVTGTGLWLLFADITPWVFRVGVVILIVSAIEEIAITFILPAWRPDVPHVFKAISLKNDVKDQ